MASPAASTLTRSEPEPGEETPCLLDAGELPVGGLALLAEREGRRPSHIYQAHKWFARRFSSAFRALLIASRIPQGGDFWDAFYHGADYRGRTVLDPFVGGGTSVVEASLLGANAIGVDIDPVACAITNFELRAADTPELSAELVRLDSQVAKRLARYYRTTSETGETRDVVHFFWVQEVPCRECGDIVEAHPHYQLAFEAEGTRQWAFCRYCNEIHDLPRSALKLRCKACRRITQIAAGTLERGTITCTNCSTTEQLIKVAERTGRPPAWRLFALETIPTGPRDRRVPMSERTFQKASPDDAKLYGLARRALARRRHGSTRWAGIPLRPIPRSGRTDDRLIQYGYTAYHQLFNDRQLLHLSLLAEEISRTEGQQAEALALAFSDHLTTNCMMTYYSLGWRRLAPLFSIRAFRHVSRPVELNPWLDGTGRGTFPNAVRQVARAVEGMKHPQVAHIDGGFRTYKRRPAEQKGRIYNGDSRKLAGVADESVDLILTDPPYFDNIAYSELSHFYLPWLEAFDLAPKSKSPRRISENLAARERGEEAYLQFRSGLSDCFRQMQRVLKRDGRLVFTYQHRAARAWVALAVALAAGGWFPVQVFPMLGNSTSGPHQHEGTILWDAVTVCKRGDEPLAIDALVLSDAQVTRARSHSQRWAERLSGARNVKFREADLTNLLNASVVAASLGMFGTQGKCGTRSLFEVLDELEKGND